MAAKKEVKKEEVKSGRKPDYKNAGVAVWKNTDKNGQEYLAVSIVGHNVVRAYPNKELNEGGEDQ